MVIVVIRLEKEVTSRELMKAFGLSEVINFSVGYDYYNGIKNFCDKLSSIISEVYSDVRNNAKIMSFLDERDREETINIVEGLNEVCKMWTRSCSDADRAKSILSLSASETRLKSGYKKNEIEKTARKGNKRQLFWCIEF